VDGELVPADRAAVDAWLRDHPEARADVDGQRRLQRLWEQAAPPDPGAVAWAGILARIETAAARPAVARRPGGRLASALRLAAGLASIAAVLLVALSLTGLFTPRRPPPPVVPLPVASTGDVEILSMDGGDLGALVVGEPPVKGPLTLASADEVTVDNSGHDVQIVRPTPEHHPSGPQRHEHQPMLIMPTDPSQGKAP
jgi:anti-sigma factor RsiW